MIQRIQSVFLALVVVIVITLFFVPIYSFPQTGVSADTQVNGTLLKSPILLVVFCCISMLSFAAIFSFKNRKRQMSLCRVGVVVSMLVSANAMLFPQFFMHSVDRSVLQFAFGSYLLPVNIILFALAARFIKKDDDKVKAADRLR